ncbi:MAG: hypothetical protein ACRCW6_00110 [Mycoplasmoidaceae bacterium]
MIFNASPEVAITPNVWIFIAHLVAFTIVILILIFFAWKPTKKFLKDKKKIINSDLFEAQEQKENALKLFDDANAKILESKEQVVKIRELSEKQAHDRWEATIKKAKIDSDAIRSKALRDVSKLEVEFNKQKRNEISKVALLAAEELMKSKIDNQENNRLVDEIIREIENNE